MKRIVQWIAFMLLLCGTGFSQKPGNCSSYQATGNTVIFNCENNAKVSLSFCSGSVVKIWYAPDGSFKRNNPSFAVVNEDLGALHDVHVEEQAQAYEIFTDWLRVRVNKSPFRLQIFDKYQKLLLNDFEDKGLLKDSNRIAAYKMLRFDEQFFGLGEKSGPLNRRGRMYTMWNSDKPCYGVTEDPLYKSIPFFLSSYRYGIFFDNTYKSVFKFGTESNDYYSFEAPGGDMVYYFIAGRDYKQIISQYTQLTGNPIMPPQWALGFSQCRGMYTNEALARNTADEFRKRKIPCDIIYQDIGWSDGLMNFDWSPERYSNPKGMLQRLDSMGFKMIVSQDPVISQKTAKQWKEADSLHYFTTDSRTGKSYDMPWPWGGNAGVVDFTKPQVADWWGAYQQKPLNDGVRGFWTDMGEPAWSNEDATDRLFMKHHLGMHDEIHNVYGFTWDKVVKEQFEKRNPGKRIFQMTRSAYAGLQRYTFGWSGDSGNGYNVLDGWSQMGNQVAMGLSAGMGLIPFWTCDISGYCGDITDHEAMAELYIRWMQFGVFTPLSRAHHEGNHAAEPWVFGKQAEDLSREAINLKYRLFPYIYTYAREAHDKGLPLMRALLLEYPDDPETFKADNEFLFGKELLVAPVVKKGAVTRKVYLPEGEWIDFNDGKTVYDGEQEIIYKAPLNVIPLFVKKGSVIPMMPLMQYIGEKKSYPVFLEVYPANENQQAGFELYEDDGETTAYLTNSGSRTLFTCTTGKDRYKLSIGERRTDGFTPGKRNYVVKLHLSRKPTGVKQAQKSIVAVAGNQLLQRIDKDFGTLVWSWDEASKTCTVKIPDTGKAVSLEVMK
ncbi:MAG: glycoside hydrolase family 31 protein [Chitinophagaceae bacterium]